MKPAVFFQKYGGKKIVSICWRLYSIFFLRSNKSRIHYLRDAGATIGERVNIGDVEILGTEPCLVEIGNRVYFAGSETRIVTHDGSMSLTYDMGYAPKPYDLFGKVKIGNNCFIGLHCIILKDVTIGDNCIIGAGSVVTKSIPTGSVACGVPARVIGSTINYYEQNKELVHDTIKWNTYRKRLYLEEVFGNQKA